MQPSYSFSIAFYRLNFHNPTYGPLFRQLYVRQALAYLVDQAGMAKTLYRGYGYPTTGPAPSLPVNQWMPAVQQGAGPYPFSIAKATSPLTSHGLGQGRRGDDLHPPGQMRSGHRQGPATEDHPGLRHRPDRFRPGGRGVQVRRGKAGIDLSTVGQTFNTIVGEALPCPVGPSCSWQAAMAGGWVYAPDYEPTGEELFATGAGANKGSYSDPTMDKLIASTTTSGSLATYQAFATYAAQQLPYIWMPNSYDVMAVSKNLHGVSFNPLGTLLPEYWYYTKS